MMGVAIAQAHVYCKLFFVLTTVYPVYYFVTQASIFHKFHISKIQETFLNFSTCWFSGSTINPLRYDDTWMMQKKDSLMSILNGRIQCPRHSPETWALQLLLPPQLFKSFLNCQSGAQIIWRWFLQSISRTDLYFNAKLSIHFDIVNIFVLISVIFRLYSRQRYHQQSDHGRINVSRLAYGSFHLAYKNPVFLFSSSVRSPIIAPSGTCFTPN